MWVHVVVAITFKIGQWWVGHGPYIPSNTGSRIDLRKHLRPFPFNCHSLTVCCSSIDYFMTTLDSGLHFKAALKSKQKKSGIVKQIMKHWRKLKCVVG